MLYLKIFTSDCISTTSLLCRNFLFSIESPLSWFHLHLSMLYIAVKFQKLSLNLVRLLLLSGIGSVYKHCPKQSIRRCFEPHSTCCWTRNPPPIPHALHLQKEIPERSPSTAVASGWVGIASLVLCFSAGRHIGCVQWLSRSPHPLMPSIIPSGCNVASADSWVHKS